MSSQPRAWTDADNLRLALLWAGELTIEEIAHEMERWPSNVKRRAVILGLPKRGKRPTTRKDANMNRVVHRGAL